MLRSLALMTFIVVLATPTAAWAGFDSAKDDDGSSTGTVTAKDQQNRPGGSGGGARPVRPSCSHLDGTVVPCQTELGWWYNAERCYMSMVSDVRPGDLEHPGLALFRCDPGPAGWDIGAPGNAMVWLEPAAGGPDPRVLAFEAMDQMRMLGIDIGMAPPPGAEALVNTPVWLWAANPNAGTWGPLTASATAGSVTVTATARAAQVVWAMGDGATVTCGQGRAYSAEAAGGSPCTHTYRVPGAKSITATTTWRVQWRSSTGVSGTETTQTRSSATIEVREARARVTSRA